MFIHVDIDLFIGGAWHCVIDSITRQMYYIL